MLNFGVSEFSKHLSIGLMTMVYVHFRINQNFSIWGFADALLGTDQEWRKSESHERSIYLFGFSSSREVLKSRRGKKG
jgi:hypothetical protein